MGFKRPCERLEPRMFGVRQPQAIAKSLRVLSDPDRERAQSERGIRLLAARGFDMREPRKPRRVGDPRQQPAEDAGFARFRHDLARARRHEQFHEFGANAFAREDRQTVALGDRRREPFGIEVANAEARRKPEKSQDAQIVLADALARIADEAHTMRREIIEAAAIIMDGSVAAQRKRVDGEIAPQGVGAEITAESHGGVATVGLDVFAQGRCLERAPVRR